MSRLWNNYQMLYIKSDVLADEDVLSILEKNGITDVVSHRAQRIPMFSDISPIQVQSDDSYLFTRNAFFTDDTGTFRIFYIPQDMTGQLQGAVDEICAMPDTVAGTDSSQSLPWLSPLVCLIFCVMCIVFSGNKKITVLSILFPLILAFTRPMYTVSAAVCLCVCAFCLLEKIYKRKDFVRHSLTSVYVVILLLLPVLLLSITSLVSALFYVLALCSSVCLIYIYEYVENLRISSKTSFEFVYIRSSKMIPLIGRKGVNLFLVTSICVLMILLTSLTGTALASTVDAQDRPALPSPVEENGTLPTLETFNQWAWSTVTFPYRKLSDIPSVPQEGTAVTIQDFVERNGQIYTEEKTVFVYDDDFKKENYERINSLNYPSLEKMLLEQGEDSQFGYTKETGSTIERFGTVLVIIFTLIPVILAGYYIIGRRKYGLGI